MTYAVLKRNLLVFGVLFFLQQSFAQTNSLGSWNILNLKYKHSEKFSFFAGGQIRSLKFYNNFHYYEFKGGINYKVFKELQLTLAGGSYQTYKEGGNFLLPKNNNEFRLWPQVQLTQKFGDFRIEQRYRAEFRFTSSSYRNRFRYRLGLFYAFGGDKKGYKPIEIQLSNELFFTNTQPYFERNRSQVAFNYKLTKNFAIQLGYLHQFDYQIDDETGRDFLVVGAYFDLFRRIKE